MKKNIPEQIVWILVGALIVAVFILVTGYRTTSLSPGLGGVSQTQNLAHTDEYSACARQVNEDWGDCGVGVPGATPDYCCLYNSMADYSYCLDDMRNYIYWNGRAIHACTD